MDLVIMTFHQSNLNEDVEGEGFASLMETVDSATPGKPCVQNDMWVG